jgi:hypothetical protein
MTFRHSEVTLGIFALILLSKVNLMDIPLFIKVVIYNHLTGRNSARKDTPERDSGPFDQSYSL